MFVTSIVIFCNCIAEMKYWPNKYSVPAFWSIWIEFGSDFAFDKYLPPFFIITCVKWVLSCRCTCLRTRECRARRWLGLSAACRGLSQQWVWALFPLDCFATGTFILVLQPQSASKPAALGWEETTDLAGVGSSCCHLAPLLSLLCAGCKVVAVQ